jgi:hypothetical protein
MDASFARRWRTPVRVDSPSRASRGGSDNSLFQSASGRLSGGLSAPRFHNLFQPRTTPAYPSRTFSSFVVPRGGMAHYRSDESIGPMSLENKTQQPGGGVPPPVGRPPSPSKRTRRKERALLIVRDEFRPAIPRSGCSPALPVSASPARPDYHVPSS